MTILNRIILGLLFLGCLVGSYYFFQNKDKHKRVQQLRFQEIELLGLESGTAAIEKLSELDEAGDISLDEKKLLAELLVDSPEFSPNRDVLDALMRENPDDTDVMVINACHSFMEGNFSESLSELRKLKDQFPANVRAQFEYHRRAFTFVGIEDRLLSKRKLGELARRADRWGYKSLQVLCFSPPQTGYLKEDLIASIDALLAHKMITSIDFLKGCELEMAVSENFDVNDFIHRADSKLGVRVDALDYGAFLIRLGLPQKALSVVRLEMAQQSRVGFFIRLMALLETRQHRKAEDLIARSRNILSSDDLSLCAIYLSVAKGSKGAVREALNDGSQFQSANALLELARLALMQGLGDEALEAFDRAWEESGEDFSIPQANQYLQLCLAVKQTEKARIVTKNLYERFPQKMGNANNFCYLSLLLGVDIEWAQGELARINREVPNNPSFLSTQALAKVLAGNAKEALEIMQRRNTPLLKGGERALMAVILDHLGERGNASKMAATVQKQEVLPEEWKLLLDRKLVEPPS
jgi:Flp pilus assembly protein TadD